MYKGQTGELGEIALENLTTHGEHLEGRLPLADYNGLAVEVSQGDTVGG